VATEERIDQDGAGREAPEPIVDGGLRPIPRRSFLQGVLGGVAAAAAANLVPVGVAHAQATGYQDAYNKLPTEDSTHSIPFYGPH
jgi:hypothetical protein